MATLVDGRKRSTASRSDSASYPHMPNFADPADYIDNISDEELLTDILKVRPNETTGMESIIILDGLPMVPPERLEKLKNVVKKIMGQLASFDVAEIINEIHPLDENNVSKGFAFYEFADSDAEPSTAARVKKAMNGYKFDKQHTLSADFFVDFDKYISVPDEAEEPTVRPFKDPGNLRYWLESDDCYDHYAVIWGGNTGTEKMTAYANSPVEPALLEERDHWTDRYAIWSPLGTYLATFHQKGVALWGGPKFAQITRFSHEGVVNAAFSPNERYILTMRNKPEHLPVDEQCLILWDVVTSAKKKSFAWSEKDSPNPNFLKWSPDENYFATMTKNECINIYNTKTFSRVVREIPGVADFSWSPAHNYLAYWVRESDNKDVPARVVLLYVPPDKDKPMEEIRSKQLFSVKDCEFYWQKNGDYMAVKVQRYKHIKKKGENKFDYGGIFHNLEIFTLIKRKEVPVESIEIRDPIVDLSWEPNGNKLVVLTVADSVTSANFYSGRQGVTFELVKKLALRHKVEKISWSPMGQFVVLHTASSGSVGYLIFVDTADLSVLADVEHFLLSDVQWDPTGRYLTAVTSSSNAGNRKDNGFTLYSFQGRYIRNEKVDGLSMFSWRPRPVSILPAEKLKDIKKNLKKYASEFETKDRLLASKASKEVSERRKRQMTEFTDFLTTKQRYFEQGRHKRVALRRGVDTDALDAHPDELVEEQLEVMVNMTFTNIE
ncbi:eukaryotic translation initiation factor 3 subunit B-like [Paramacrobiotus metropolitanus]|uniref:eukaryotic translation initiation factor 3 subunit B-like n=1 Tax=Paramacrobiotus metropolitanus TaxID=2943436 RepID=UPI002445F350|nr:eukaryotic translation initiation factor 3 subunit B-like [Paramacrobiotus metropolitanus]